MDNDKTPAEPEAKKKKLFQIIKWVILLVGFALVLMYKIFDLPTAVGQIGMWLAVSVFVNGIINVFRGVS